MSFDARSAIVGWLAGRPSLRKLAAFVAAAVALILFIWWCIRNPKYSIPPVLGILAAIQWHSLSIGFQVCVVGYVFCVYLWGRALLGCSEIDTWRELVYGLPRIWRVYRHWPVIVAKVSPSVTRKDEVPVLSQMRLSTSGVIATVDTSNVVKNATVLKKIEHDLAAGFRADRVLFKTERNWLSTLRIDWGAHLRRQYVLHDLPSSTNARKWPYRIPFAIAESGEAAELVANHPILIGGITGSGKSNTAWAILAGYIASGVPICVDVIDPKGEFAEMKQYVGNGFIKSYTGPDADPDEYDKRIERFVEAMKRRVTAMGIETQHVPTETEPLRLLIVDEGLPLAESLKKQGARHPLMKVSTQGRAVNYIPLFLTQLGQKDVLGHYSDTSPNRICMKTSGRHSTEVILGEGCEGNGARCSYLDSDSDKGVGYMLYRGGYMGWRSPIITAADRASLAQGIFPEAPVDPSENDDKPQTLYRIYGKFRGLSDQFLYIGRTRIDRGTPAHQMDLYSDEELARRAASNRLSEHKRDQPWSADIERIEVRGSSEIFPNRAAAEVAEELAIRTERPPYNKEHADYNKKELTNA